MTDKERLEYLTSKPYSQTTKILKHLYKVGSLTSLEAMAFYKCARLASRVSEIREMGFLVLTEMEKNDSNNGYHARYHLKVRS